MSTPRDRARAQTLADITRLGREHLTTYGAAGLSLRAVARDLGVVSSAVYRYVPSRDDLLTLLVVDGYGDLADGVEAAERAVPRADHVARLQAIAAGVRAWAVANPARWGLLYGSPVPGYRAPAERTTEPGTRVIGLLLALVAEAEAVGAQPAAPVGGVPAALRADAERIRAETGLTVSDPMLLAGVLTWVAVFGAVSFEVFGQYGADTFAEPGGLLAAQVQLLAGVLGLL